MHVLAGHSGVEGLYHDAFEHAPVAMAHSMPDGRLLAVNGALASLLRVTREVLVSRGLTASVHHEDLIADCTAWNRLVSGEVSSLQLEQRRVRGDGTVIRTLLRRSAVRGPTGHVALITSVIDVIGMDDGQQVSQLLAQTEQLEAQAAELQQQAAQLELTNTEISEALRSAETAREEAEQAEREERAILMGIRDLVFVLDADGKYLKIPRYSPDLLYAPEGDLLGRRMHDVLPAAIADGLLVTIRRALAIGETVKSEYSMVFEGRRASRFAATVTPIAEDRVVWVSRDITEERAAEHSLRLSEQRYRLLFDANPMPMWVYDRSTQRFLDVNTAAVMQYGFSRDEFLSMTLAEIRPPSELPRLRRALERGPGSLNRSDGWRHRRKDGSIIDVEITAHTIDFEGHDAELVLAHDVTAQRLAEKGLRETTAFLEAVVEDSPLAIATVNLERRVTRWNPAAERMLGRTAEEMIGREYDSLIPDDRPERYPDTWQGALTGGEVARFGTYYRRRDGSRVDVDISVAGLHGPDGIVSGVMLILTDTTAQRKLEAQLRQSQKMEVVGQLAGGVAHDFNNLLSAINGYSDLLLQDVSLDDARRDDLLEIKQASRRAAALTRQLLTFSRQQVVQLRPVGLNTIVTGLGSMLRRLMREDIALVLKLQASPDVINADPGQLEQVVMNLVVNARDAIKDVGEIVVETARTEVPTAERPDDQDIPPGRYVVLRVTDTGSGMTAQTLERLFEPFFTTKEVGKGTGLGLATVYGIVAQANGHIGCTSELGSGSTFTIHLPVSDDEYAAVSESGSVGDSTQPGEEVILLVEDEETVRMVAKRILTGCGYTVLEARCGEDALALLERHPGSIDLVITDMVMPGMSGPALVKRLRDQSSALRVLYISGYSRDVIDRKIEFSAESAYLEKPFTAKSLAAMTRKLLEHPV